MDTVYVSSNCNKYLTDHTFLLVLTSRSFPADVGYKTKIHYKVGQCEWACGEAEYFRSGGRQSEVKCYWRLKIQTTLDCDSVDTTGSGEVYYEIEYNNRLYGSIVRHRIALNAGVTFYEPYKFLSYEVDQFYADDAQTLTITAAVKNLRIDDDVLVHYSSDNWKTVHDLKLHPFFRNSTNGGSHQDVTLLSSTFNISTDTNIVDYALCWKKEGSVMWDNNDGANYRLRRGFNYKILTLNLHCYQEDNQDHKLTLIAQSINELNVDIICLQEVGEDWNEGNGNWPTNASKIIQDRIQRPTFLYFDWAHLGFNRYREGLTIISLWPLLKTESRYVSASQNVFDFNARKIVMASIILPSIGLINIFSVHLSWIKEGFLFQVDHLHQWVEYLHYKTQINGMRPISSILAGDFNVSVKSSGQERMVALGLNDLLADSIHLSDSFERIDYILSLEKPTMFNVSQAIAIFTPKDYGYVSDHVGYYVTITKK
ncbi:unnamed protein product [Didymodactylos carnosus]|uniref:CBM21 domain-containing protein n=1 Tax=Didymodactylos carnosus TaxID=1234261 RepID=A0A814ISX4_9BILA|nr:unnamed protein product [Didymodactylos carnosus]CAF1028537.1 unnamed protein product [Didymodactylos carnosus]CAF3781034.1 unnamed protein product [Didymodactylos carnosus]CAF3799448.1 unnamed protein product [Didymodactylos carnosus]